MIDDTIRWVFWWAIFVIIILTLMAQIGKAYAQPGTKQPVRGCPKGEVQICDDGGRHWKCYCVGVGSKQLDPKSRERREGPIPYDHYEPKQP